MDTEFVAVLRPYLKYAGDREITADARLRDLGLDSMRAIELLFAIEDTFGVSIPDERLTDETFETGRSLWSVVEELRT
ncbi:phosphopantetheine-binding protein [Kibdelosporangium persicum]|uniref:Phosphopantetheine attachment site n=1 Tax=Kibdelosporangium persicum TaxID=2698649 RepID=A0ABX2FDG7_9PSEU|nr:phosphopantetheine-binding protein [Kibdelosporangium persicum]NRN69414.1 Phosphopantetheine attachment site [Kibdelosporangium persicum]